MMTPAQEKKVRFHTWIQRGKVVSITFMAIGIGLILYNQYEDRAATERNRAADILSNQKENKELLESIDRKLEANRIDTQKVVLISSCLLQLQIGGNPISNTDIAFCQARANDPAFVASYGLSLGAPLAGENGDQGQAVANGTNGSNGGSGGNNNTFDLGDFVGDTVTGVGQAVGGTVTGVTCFLIGGC